MTLVALYTNPFVGASGLKQTRVDQGVDFTGSGTISAIGKAKIVGVSPGATAGWEGGPYLFYELLEGSDKGKLIYVAEGITPLVKPGEIVQEGQAIATFVKGGSIETGWASPTANVSLSAATEGPYKGSGPTGQGSSFASFLSDLPGGSGSAVQSGLGPTTPLEQLAKGGSALGHLLGIPSVGELGQKAGEGIVEWVAPTAKKAALYFVFIIGGLAMMVFGLSEMLKPVGGPDLAGKAKSAGKLAVAGAAA